MSLCECLCTISPQFNMRTRKKKRQRCTLKLILLPEYSHILYTSSGQFNSLLSFLFSFIFFFLYSVCECVSVMFACRFAFICYIPILFFSLWSILTSCIQIYMCVCVCYVPNWFKDCCSGYRLSFHFISWCFCLRLYFTIFFSSAQWALFWQCVWRQYFTIFYGIKFSLLPE